MFCLLADIEIRQRTRNQKGLEDALRGVMNSGGVITEDWALQHVFEVADKAAGVTVLQELYTKMKDKPVSVDLDKLFARLGVVRNGDVAKFDDHAPLASIREAISTGKPGKAAAMNASLDSLISNTAAH